MWLCVRKTLVGGRKGMAPKPQDACALPREDHHGPAKNIYCT
jgi:hypothetical protein